MQVYKLFDRGISKSFLETFSACREACRLQYLKGYYPVKEGFALDFGTAFHACNAHLQTIADQTWEGVQHVCTKYAREYIAKRKKYMDKPSIEEFQEMMERVAVTLDEYRKRWAKDDAKVEWVEREKEFALWLEYEYADDTMFLVPFKGYRDGVFYRKDRKGGMQNLYLFETKTKTKWDQADIRDLLEHDLQTMLYLFSMQSEYGRLPKGVRYDLVKRPSTLIKGGAERVRTFIQKSPKGYFWRHDWNTVRQRHLTSWRVKFLDGLIRQVVDWVLGFYPDWRDTAGRREINDPYDNPHHFANSANLVTFWGRDPMFDAVTRGKLDGLVHAPESARKCIIPIENVEDSKHAKKTRKKRG